MKMLKAKVSDKEIRDGYYTIALGYCDAQNILKYKAARFYNYGVYGWRYDVYELAWNLAICTGYQPIKSIPEKLNRKAVEIIEKYDKKAAALNSSNYKNYKNYGKAIERLYNKMVGELLEVVNYNTVSKQA